MVHRMAAGRWNGFELNNGMVNDMKNQHSLAASSGAVKTCQA
jgi:hypothetical protein